MNPDQVIIDLESQPWYQSTQGPKLSQALKGVVGLLLPVIQDMFPGKITTSIQWLDRTIDILLIVGFGTYALLGYIKARKAAAAQIGALKSQIKFLGGTPKL